MMILKLWLIQLERLFNGKYVINRSKGLYVSSKINANSDEKLYPFSEVLNGLAIAGYLVKLQFGQMFIKLPQTAKVQVYSALGWRTVWNGTDPVFTNQAEQVKYLEFSFKRETALKLIYNGQVTMISVLDSRKVSDFFPKIPPLSELLYHLSNVGKSFLAHIIFGFIIIFVGSYLNTHLNFPTEVEMAKKEEKIEELIPIEIPKQVVQEETVAEDTHKSSIKTQQTVQERSQKIASKLSGLTAKMAKMSIGGLNNVSEVKNLADANMVVNSLKDKLGVSNKVDLKGEFKVVAKGTAGDTSFWNLVSTKEKGISSKDLEEVANIFRSLQDQFRGCYESALLQNEQLSVTVHYEALVLDSGKLGDPQFVASGNSDKKSEAHLFGCLGKVLKQVKLNKGLTGAKIRNQFIFKS